MHSAILSYRADGHRMKSAPDIGNSMGRHFGFPALSDDVLEGAN